MQRTHINKPFTLVELMVVISIMIIILSLSAPAFRKLAMGSSVDVAARMVSSQLMLARAEAISRRECIAVVMPDKDFIKDENDISNYPYTAFRSAIVEEKNGNYVFKEWIPNTNWSFLPTGAVIYDVRNTPPSDTLLKYENGGYTLKKELNKENYDEGSSETLSEHENASDDPDSEYKKMFYGKSNSNVPCIIFKKTGKAVGQNFVFITEGVSTDSKIERENLNNIHLLEVNQYTGQTKFAKINR